VNSLDNPALRRGLYVITDAALGGGHLPIARAAVAGGARIVQLRDKSARPLSKILAEARAVRAITQASDVLLFINDRLDLALACEADGVHLGPDDLPVAAARRIVPAGFLVGASCGTPDEARRATDEGANIIGAGAIFGTQTKKDAGDAIGVEALSAIVAATSLPVAAIGGVSLANIARVTAAGASFACVVSAVASAGDEIAMTQSVGALIRAAGFK
jgi:thiamine-phosphate pyrophosphorylase